MKLSLLLTTLPPLLTLASPAPEPADVDGSISLDPRGAISRPQYCSIVGGSSKVSCRARWRTTSDVKHKLPRGNSYNFWCVYTGQCITVNGATNCGWHYLRDLDCWVNGHYTSSLCTKARLGGCGDFDLDGEYSARPFGKE
ncbi:hypothetical protein M011DRAFT_479852 [Sporormia fimetaria CBS 119925]|uniref:Cyanovirin-N domain-containing protein n=1 Tax=Sporormia fimetaria CBS 119925 TaxID=1340428 RepID=A0A6A6V1Y1_9PLEO|nr:hypothetical protein M011DRAFT_479852 [Sporormia fimetaria CBS 119925]